MPLLHARALDIIDIRPLGSGLDDAVTTSLVKTPALQLMRLVLRAGQAVPQHSVAGAITVEAWCPPDRDADHAEHHLDHEADSECECADSEHRQHLAAARRDGCRTELARVAIVDGNSYARLPASALRTTVLAR